MTDIVILLIGGGCTLFLVGLLGLCDRLRG